jgi:NAD-reducing hydrogenase large subunit
MVNRVLAVVRSYDPCLSCSTHANGLLAMNIRPVDCEGTLLDELHTD